MGTPCSGTQSDKTTKQGHTIEEEIPATADWTMKNPETLNPERQMSQESKEAFT